MGLYLHVHVVSTCHTIANSDVGSSLLDNIKADLISWCNPNTLTLSKVIIGLTCDMYTRAVVECILDKEVVKVNSENAQIN